MHVCQLVCLFACWLFVAGGVAPVGCSVCACYALSFLHTAKGLEHFPEGTECSNHILEHDDTVTQTDGSTSAPVDATDSVVLLGEFTALVAQLEDIETRGKFRSA
eukprot:TRINITY_DN1909_c0_g2_i1.p2 TRINITY_DN1909_c0_g2~~TRINITY_DN1909_c0_g2_i1.p2  ORF type:complete len:105 (+),score=8.19 TRINITY_DN1909_c0_g2_i1:429-743(+)